MTIPATDHASVVLARCDELAAFTEEPGRLTRRFGTRALGAAGDTVAGWMREAGMTVRRDAVGNVIGRREGGPRTLLLGSHLDTVVDAGRYDGALGELAAIAAVERAGELPYAVEVYGFADEEGIRFRTAYLGSAAVAGTPPDVELADRDGVRLGDLLDGDPATARRDPADLIGYVEVHIEQGPVLLHEGLALGVVTTIAGGTRHLVRVRGAAGHAGTVPMPMRHDALAAASEMVLEVERRCSAVGSLVGTVGILKVKDATRNVIPGEVEFTVDIRSAEDAVREAAERDVFDAFEAIAARRGVAVERTKTHGVHAVPCADWLQDRVAASVEAVGVKARRLPSGAGHDAMILAEICDVGMLFVRCGAGGVSHNPAETVTAADCGIAVEAVLDLLRRFQAP
jgi:allantoate deiminase